MRVETIGEASAGYCVQCTAPIVRSEREGTRTRRFCAQPCYHAWQKGRPNAGTFSVGDEPWNKNVKGIHLSQSTEFKRGQPGINHVPVSTESIRLDKHTKTPRYYIKVAEPNVWRLRAVLVYEKHYGSVPTGYVVHHRDHDSVNDSPDNLVALTRAEHLNEHRVEIMAAKSNAYRQQRLEFA